jgi:hypothetical protein
MDAVLETDLDSFTPEVRASFLRDLVVHVNSVGSDTIVSADNFVLTVVASGSVVVRLELVDLDSCAAYSAVRERLQSSTPLVVGGISVTFSSLALAGDCECIVARYIIAPPPPTTTITATTVTTVTSTTTDDAASTTEDGPGFAVGTTNPGSTAAAATTTSAAAQAAIVTHTSFAGDADACGELCLQEVTCVSFTMHDDADVCALYDHVDLKHSAGVGVVYYIEAEIGVCTTTTSTATRTTTTATTTTSATATTITDTTVTTTVATVTDTTATTVTETTATVTTVTTATTFTDTTATTITATVTTVTTATETTLTTATTAPTTTSTQTVTTITTVDCPNGNTVQADVLLIVDTSMSTEPCQQEGIKNYAAEIVRGLGSQVNGNGVRFAFMTYSKDADLQFAFNEPSLNFDPALIVTKVLNIPTTFAAPTRIETAFNLTRQTLLPDNAGNGFRNFEVPLIVITVLDGATLDESVVAAELGLPVFDRMTLMALNFDTRGITDDDDEVR